MPVGDDAKVQKRWAMLRWFDDHRRIQQAATRLFQGNGHRAASETLAQVSDPSLQALRLLKGYCD